jgi:hypothetical protein
MRIYQNPLLGVIFSIILFSACGGEKAGQLRGVTKEEREQIARDSSNYTYIRWLETSINFGTIRCGEKVKLIYRFKNVGEKPLFILSVTEACNCALTEYNTDPVQPGKQGTIAVTFDSKTQAEAIRKSLVVQTNTFQNRYQTLIFTGYVRDCCGGANGDEESDEESPYIIK